MGKALIAMLVAVALATAAHAHGEKHVCHSHGTMITHCH